MTELNTLGVCRLCLIRAETKVELSEYLTNIISTCFSIKIHISSQFAHKICEICVDQLENVYKYRKKIIRNELILLRKLKNNITDNSTEFCIKDLETDNAIGINELPEDHTIDTVDDQFNHNEDDVTNDIDFDIEIDKQQKNNTLESNPKVGNQKEHEQITKVEVAKIRCKDFDYLKSVEIYTGDDAINNVMRDQFDMKAVNLNANKGERIDKISGKICNLTVNLKSDIHPEDSILEINKENIVKNKDFTANQNTSVYYDKIKNANINSDHNIYNINNSRRKFMCLTCLEVFGSQKELSVHYKTVEFPKAGKDTIRKCKDTNIVKTSKNDAGKTIFNCGACGKAFDSKGSVIRHTQAHKVDRPYQCNLCSRTYKTVADILRHGVVHDGFKFVCSYDCGYATVHLGALREHVKRHNKEFKYKCDKCGKCFQVKTWYEQHQNIHDKVRPFVCKLCGQAFSMERYLTAHQANVHPQSAKIKRYKCVHCSLPCDSRKSLVMHMKQKHGMKTDCLCDVCGQILPDKQKLVLHKSVHQASRQFSCRFCKKTFKKKDHKTVHEKIHTGDRLNCNSCSKSFTQRCSLRRHIKRYHQGDQRAIEQNI